MEMKPVKKHKIIFGLCCTLMLNQALAQKEKPDSISFSTPVYSISGKLNFCNSDSVVRTAAVSLLDSNQKVVKQAYTDVTGFYQLTWVNAGNYTLKFEWSGEHTSIALKVLADINLSPACLPVLPPVKPSIDSSKAGADINSGIVQIYICDPGAPLTQASLDQLAKKYGFHFTLKGKCLLSGPDEKAFDAYNAQVMRYLDTINQQGWRANLNDELQALINSLSPGADAGPEFFLN